MTVDVLTIPPVPEVSAMRHILMPAADCDWLLDICKEGVRLFGSKPDGDQADQECVVYLPDVADRYNRAGICLMATVGARHITETDPLRGSMVSERLRQAVASISAAYDAIDDTVSQFELENRMLIGLQLANIEAMARQVQDLECRVTTDSRPLPEGVVRMSDFRRTAVTPRSIQP